MPRVLTASGGKPRTSHAAGDGAYTQASHSMGDDSLHRAATAPGVIVWTTPQALEA